MDTSGISKPSPYISDAFFPSDKNLTTDVAKRGLSSGRQYTASNSSLNTVSRSISSELERSKQNALSIPRSFVDTSHISRRRSLNDGIRPLDVLFKQSTENSTMEKTSDGPPVPLFSKTLPTKPSKSSSQQRLDETYTITTALPHSQNSPTNEVSKFIQHEPYDTTASVPSSHLSSPRQSYRTEDTTVVLNPGETLTAY